MGKYTDIIGKTGLMPAVTVTDSENAVSLAETFLSAGVLVAEITLRTDEAFSAIKKIREETDLIIGAGTVLTAAAAEKALDSGAEFLVSPGVSPSVIKFAQEREAEIIPGVATPTEIELAMSFGIRVMKFFPADVMGGPRWLKAMSGPYGSVKFIPMGGITTENMREYLSEENVFALGGPWMAKPEMIESKRFDVIEYKTKEILEIIKNFKSPKI